MNWTERRRARGRKRRARRARRRRVQAHQHREQRFREAIDQVREIAAADAERWFQDMANRRAEQRDWRRREREAFEAWIGFYEDRRAAGGQR